jgi:hypothetical protein
MKRALTIAAVALALGLATIAYVTKTISDYRLDGSQSAGIIAAFPLFGVALLALGVAIRRRDQPDAPLAKPRLRDLVTLLVLSGGWVFVILLI